MRKEFWVKLNGDESRKDASAAFTLPFDTREVGGKANVTVYSLYALGVGRAARSSWDLQIGLSGLSKLADETGRRLLFSRHFNSGHRAG